jgi:uncharacterized membrane protein
LWLIVLEVLVISTAWSFSPTGIAELGGRPYVGLQVIWAIGASMVVLAGAQFLGRRACLAIGAAVVLGHNFLDPVWPAASTTGTTGPLWAVLHARQLYEVGPVSVYFSYPLLPWIGVMLVGYGAAGLFELPAKLRDYPAVVARPPNRAARSAPQCRQRHRPQLRCKAIVGIARRFRS